LVVSIYLDDAKYQVPQVASTSVSPPTKALNLSCVFPWHSWPWTIC